MDSFGELFDPLAIVIMGWTFVIFDSAVLARLSRLVYEAFMDPLAVPCINLRFEPRLWGIEVSVSTPGEE